MAGREIDFASRKHIWQSYGSLLCFCGEVTVFLYCILASLFAMGQAGKWVGAACAGIAFLAAAGAYIAYIGLKRKGRIYRKWLKAGLFLNLTVLVGMIALYMWGSSMG